MVPVTAAPEPAMALRLNVPPFPSGANFTVADPVTEVASAQRKGPDLRTGDPAYGLLA